MPPGPRTRGFGGGRQRAPSNRREMQPPGLFDFERSEYGDAAVGDECQENKVRLSASVDADLVATAEAAVAKGRSGSVGVARLMAAPGIDAGVIAV